MDGGLLPGRDGIAQGARCGAAVPMCRSVRVRCSKSGCRGVGIEIEVSVSRCRGDAAEWTFILSFVRRSSVVRLSFVRCRAGAALSVADGLSRVLMSARQHTKNEKSRARTRARDLRGWGCRSFLAPLAISGRSPPIRTSGSRARPSASSATCGRRRACGIRGGCSACA